MEVIKDVNDAGPADMNLLNRTISRLYHMLEIDKKRPEASKTGKSNGPPNPRIQGYHKKYMDRASLPKGASGRDAQTLSELKTKLEKFEKHLQTKFSHEKDELKTLHSELQNLRTSWMQQEKQLERLKGTHMIIHKAKGKHVELLEERRMADKKDIEDKLLELEENIRKNLPVTDDSPPSTKEDLSRLKSEILKVHRLLDSRLSTPPMVSQNRRHRSKLEADDLSDMIRIMGAIGGSVQQLNLQQETLDRCQIEVKQWNIYVHDVDLNLDDLCQNLMSAEEIAEMDKDIIRLAVRFATEQERKTEKMKMKIRQLKKIMSQLKRNETDKNKVSIEIAGDLRTTQSRLHQLMEAIEDVPNNSLGGRANSVMTLQSMQSSSVAEQFENSLKKLEDMKVSLEQQKRLQASGDKFVKDTENDLHALKTEIESLSSHVVSRTGDVQLDSSTYRVPKFGDNYVSTTCQILLQKLRKIQLGVDQLMTMDEEKQNVQASGDLKQINDGVQGLCARLHIAAMTNGDDYVQNILTNLHKCQQHASEMEGNSSKKDKEFTDISNSMKKLKDGVKKLYDVTDTGKISTIHEENRESDQSESIEQQLAIISDRFSDMRSRMSDLESKLQYEKEQYRRETSLKESEAKLKLQVTVREQELMEQNKVISRLREDTILKNTENTRLQLELNDRYRSTLSMADEEKIYLKNKIEDLTRKLDTAETSLNEALKEKYGLLTRLSAAAGTKLFDGTLSIWDHSDPYRPIKMAERFSDLFDTEWGSAHQTLKNHYHMDEKEVVQALLEVITEAFSFCVAMSDIQITEIHKVLFLMNIEETKDPSLHDYVKHLSDEDVRQIRDIRKWSAPHAKNKVLGLFLNSGIKLQLSKQQLQACEIYVSKCVELCWLMCVQTPPLHLSWSTKSGERFEHTVHRQMFYNKGGEIIDYLVWPTLHIMKNGDVLCKGIVRTKKTLR